MSIPVLQPRLFLGLRTGVRKSVQYLSELEILYPAGGVLIAHNYTQKRQRFCFPADKMRPLSCVAISPNRKNIAVADIGEKPMVTIYDAVSLKRKKVLFPPPDTQAKEFQHICFTHENKFLLAVLGDPDWMLISYVWEKGKIDSTYKAFNPQNPGPILELYPNPSDSSMVCAVGPGLFRLLTMTENVWKQFGFNKSDSYPLTCLCWLSSERVLAGTDDGRLLLVESGDLKAVYKAMDIHMIDLKSLDPIGMSAGEDSEGMHTSVTMTIDDIRNVQIRELVAFSRGFAFAFGVGAVYLFEKDDNFKYLKRNVFVKDFLKTGKITSNEDNNHSDDENMDSIKTLTVSPNGNNMIVTTGRSQLYTVPLWGPDIHECSEIPFTPMGERLHQGPIAALSVCSWKTIFMTCGQIDHTVCVWNYTTDALELSKWYHEEILSASLHPTGLFALVGFADKLRYMELLIDDIKTIREFPLKECKLCNFSKNGHLFAVADVNLIYIYSSVTHALSFTLKGHNGMVKGITWNVRDTKLVSCGSDGAIYEWNVNTGKKTGEIIDKTCEFTSVSMTTDGKSSYVVGSDGCLREITDSQLVRQQLILKDGLNIVVLSRSDLMLFVTGGNGSVISFKFPLSQTPEFNEYHMHNQPVTSMCLSFDDMLLLTSSEDGSICVWKLTATEGKTVKLDKDFTFSNNILIPKEELIDKINTIKDLILNMKTLIKQHTSKMSAIKADQAKKITEIRVAYTQAVNELKERIEITGQEHTDEIYAINADIAKLKETHNTTVETYETNFKAKLLVEYDKYAALDENTHKMRQQYMGQLQDLTESKRKALLDLTANYEAQLQEKQFQIEDLRHAASKLIEDDEEINKRIEDDADREILEAKTVFEAKLKEERETISNLQGEASITKKKYIGSLKEIELYKQQIQRLQAQHQKVLKTINSHDKAIADLKREMQERDATIPEKEARIFDMKRKNQELEKYKFVLNYKIEELENQIRPKELDIGEKKQLMAEMEEELVGLQKINNSLGLQTQELKEKLRATLKELERVKDKNRKHNSTLSRMRLDIHNAYEIIEQPKKLKVAIKDLYHKYSMDPAYVSTKKIEEDVQLEFMRQREFLEHTIRVLQKQVNPHTSGKVGEAKILEEHAELTEQVNTLRCEVKNAHRLIREMESILGPETKQINPKQAQDKLEAAIKSREAIKHEYEEKIRKLDEMNNQLKDEVDKLRNKISSG